MKLNDRLVQLEAVLVDLLEEVRELRGQVLSLEAQNEQLRVQLFARREHRDGYLHLSKLYEEGFHICPPRFGQGRGINEDCIFCLNFMQRQQRGE